MEIPNIIHRVIHLGAAIVATLVYSVWVVRPRSPGLPRLLASLPAIVVFTLSPAIVAESLVLSGGVGLTLMWVASFKLLAYSGGRGALSHPAVASGGNWQWAALLVLPFFPTKSGRQPSSSSSLLALAGVLSKLGVWLGLNALLLAPPEGMTATMRHICYAVYMWMFVSLCLDAASPLSGRLLQGVPLQPAMEAPYAATSVREFWGRRYNQIVSATLLETVYKPIVQGSWVAPQSAAAAHTTAPSAPGAAQPADSVSPQLSASQAAGVHSNVAVRAGPLEPKTAPAAAAAEPSGESAPPRRRTSLVRALVALAASFVVSGIMHEACIAFMCGGRLEGSFRMLAFFVVQPFLILAQELAVAALLPKNASGGVGIAVGLLQRGITLALVLSSAELFWAALESCRIDQRGLEEVVGAMTWVAERVKESGWVPLVGA